MIRRPPRSTLDRSSAASDVYKRQAGEEGTGADPVATFLGVDRLGEAEQAELAGRIRPVSYTHLRAPETVLDLVCRLLLEKKNIHKSTAHTCLPVNPKTAYNTVRRNA